MFAKPFLVPTVLVWLASGQGFLLAQQATWEFICEGHSNWLSTVQFLTTADRIRFVGPLDRTYGNACEAEKGGVVSLIIDPARSSLELHVDISEPHGCPRNYAPVTSAAVEFGPLPAGTWVFWSSAYHFTNAFTVYPDPPPPELITRSSAGQVSLEWQIVPIRQDSLEYSTDMIHWLPSETPVTVQDSTMKTSIPPEGGQQFFRVKRSPIPQTIPVYPVNCGA